jgi:hypothetical protein
MLHSVCYLFCYQQEKCLWQTLKRFLITNPVSCPGIFLIVTLSRLCLGRIGLTFPRVVASLNNLLQHSPSSVILLWSFSRRSGGSAFRNASARISSFGWVMYGRLVHSGCVRNVSSGCVRNVSSGAKGCEWKLASPVAEISAMSWLRQSIS